MLLCPAGAKVTCSFLAFAYTVSLINPSVCIRSSTRSLRVSSAVRCALLLAALVGQVRSRKYVPWLYWLAVVLTSVDTSVNPMHAQRVA